MIDTARFGLLLFCVDGPLAGHIPFVLHRAQGRFGTLARHLGDGHEALAVFSGPRAYVSPRWYSDGGLPTYNFLAVHALGRPRLLEDRDGVIRELSARGSDDDRAIATAMAANPYALPG